MSATMTATGTTTQSLTDTTVCLQVRLGCLGVRAKMDASKVDAGDMDKAMLHVSKDILQSDELQAIYRHAAEIRSFVKARSLPSLLRGGIYLVPVAGIPGIEEGLESMKVVRRGLIEKFMEAYPKLVEDARVRLGEHFDEADYPTPAMVKKAFSLDIRYLTFSTPSSLKNVSSALFEREQKKAERAWAVAHDEIITLLRAEFKKLVDHMADRLSVGEDGKKKVFRDTAVSNLASFMDTFDPRNVCNDADLSEMVKKARALLSGVDAETLRSNDQLRAHTQEQFSKMSETLGTMVTAKPSRLISLSEEE